MSGFPVQWYAEEVAPVPAIEVPDVSDELLTQMDERARQLKLSSRAEYVRRLIINDLERAQLAKPTTFRDILEPVHRQVAESGMTEAQLDTLLDESLENTRAERRRRNMAR
jgi:hypothetical protein